MEDALAEAERLLRCYGYNYAANLAAIAADLYRRDPGAACRAVNDAEWWEGSESVASIDLAIAGGFTAGSRADAQAFRSALIVIYTTLRAYGEHNTAGELVVSQFDKWTESHV